MRFSVAKGSLVAVALLVLAISSSASTLCVPLGSYPLASTCNPASFKIYGDGASGQSVGTTQGLITGNTFQVGFDNNSSAADVLIIAVFSNNTVAGSLNGFNFSALGSDPFGANHDGAIHDTFAGLGFPTGPLAYGWLDLGQGVTSGNKLTVNMSGISSGVIFYAQAVDPFIVVLSSTTVCDKFNPQGKCTKSHTEDVTGTQNQIDNINANSEAGVTKFAPPATPEPASLVLLGSGLIGLALRRRKK